jgi:organic hydroperoxide reductase OsmC/OhrA
MPEDEETRSFRVRAGWSGDGAGSGEVTVNDGAFAIPVAGAISLGGSGGKANPEELLLAAVAACFANTWAIFLKKLGIDYSEPTLRVDGDLGADPAGGFRMEKIAIHARVPKALLAERRAQIEKTLKLAEKYCVISKVGRAAMPLTVEIEEI